MSGIQRHRRRRLWFGVFAAPLAWSVAHLASVALIGRSCGAGADELPGWLWALLWAVSLTCAAIAAAGALVALGTFRDASRGASNTGILRAEGRSPPEFLAQLGFFVSSLLFLNIVFYVLTPWIVNRCSGVT